jgi:hypothetical protein
MVRDFIQKYRRGAAIDYLTPAQPSHPSYGRYVWLGPGLIGQSRSFDVMPISRPDGLGEIANLGLTLAEAKLLLAQVPQQVVAALAHRGQSNAWKGDPGSDSLH